MISDQDVRYIAALARINLNDEEIAPLAKDLENILGYIGQLEELDVAAVKPTSHVLPLQNVYRSDTIKPSLSQDEALSIAVAKHNGAFKVPQIID
ncbi:MAG TPA: Asp-tRNA(Asn)/Glu-tRNA(Gln) amidotransferase subunit GatC [Candidatus Bathyarchaeia archaeon]|nr:Asp-tRNA(Asn)/Glu-tRNA(Gln) amidotransferase subunit GatC [Candidatus Bathyarchaeia archaeon]